MNIIRVNSWVTQQKMRSLDPSAAFFPWLSNQPGLHPRLNHQSPPITEDMTYFLGYFIPTWAAPSIASQIPTTRPSTKPKKVKSTKIMV